MDAAVGQNRTMASRNRGCLLPEVLAVGSPLRIIQRALELADRRSCAAVGLLQHHTERQCLSHGSSGNTRQRQWPTSIVVCASATAWASESVWACWAEPSASALTNCLRSSAASRPPCSRCRSSRSTSPAASAAETAHPAKLTSWSDRSRSSTSLTSASCGPSSRSRVSAARSCVRVEAGGGG